jgi:plastocyanin
MVRRVVRNAAALSLVALRAISPLSAATASAQEMQTATVCVTEYRFNPNAITLTVGKPVELNVLNQGQQDHSLLSSIPVSGVHYVKADNTRGEQQSYEANNVINADAGAGHTSVVIFTPTRAGTFEFFSKDEEDLGLVGNFVVVSGQAPTASAPAPMAVNVPAAQPSGTVAKDEQSLASQSAATQATFNAVWGNQAATVWVQQHNAAVAM